MPKRPREASGLVEQLEVPNEPAEVPKLRPQGEERTSVSHESEESAAVATLLQPTAIATPQPTMPALPTARATAAKQALLKEATKHFIVRADGQQVHWLFGADKDGTGIPAFRSWNGPVTDAIDLNLHADTMQPVYTILTSGRVCVIPGVMGSGKTGFGCCLPRFLTETTGSTFVGMFVPASGIPIINEGDDVEEKNKKAKAFIHNAVNRRVGSTLSGGDNALEGTVSLLLFLDDAVNFESILCNIITQHREIEGELEQRYGFKDVFMVVAGRGANILTRGNVVDCGFFRVPEVSAGDRNKLFAMLAGVRF